MVIFSISGTSARSGSIDHLMEDVIAIRARTDQGQVRYWRTWGRLFDPVEPDPMIAAVRPHLRWSDKQGEIVEITICVSLQEASDQPYFYEGLFWLGRRISRSGTATTPGNTPSATS
jgi:hypothetical protein